MTYLLIDELSEGYYIGRRQEGELLPSLVEGMQVGDIRPMGEGEQRFFVTRES